MRLKNSFLVYAALVAASASFGAVACSGSADAGGLFGEDGGGGGGPGGNGADGSVGTTDGGGGGNGDGGGGGGGDGSSGNDGGGGGGCHPSSANAEIPGNGCDDDGDGKTDNVGACDNGLAIDGDAVQFARAIGLCDDATKRGFGVLSASFTRGHGAAAAGVPQQHGILGKFGSKILPREGLSLGVLSTGYAREYDDEEGGTTTFNGGQDWDMTIGAGGSAPPTFPRTATGCEAPGAVHDVIVLKLVLKAPPNATGFSFDHDFYGSDWPVFMCDQYNDAFIAYLSAQGFNGGAADNIAFAPGGNPISVNMSFLDRCTPGAYTGCESLGTANGVSTCAGGTAELVGTGYYNPSAGCGYPPPDGGADANDDAAPPPDPTGGAAGGWLTTVAPVKAGETFTLELMIWDSADGVLDSTILLDHFHWIDTSVNAATTRAK